MFSIPDPRAIAARPAPVCPSWCTIPGEDHNVERNRTLDSGYLHRHRTWACDDGSAIEAQWNQAWEGTPEPTDLGVYVNLVEQEFTYDQSVEVAAAIIRAASLVGQVQAEGGER